jgi:phosphoribosylaminoimidazolecarboxamide formyltransferase / IMP cyclohydrolase
MPTAFLSVYDKTNLDTLATALVEQAGYNLVATGGTRRYLLSAGLSVTDLSAVTGFDELLGGRVKSLHPVVFASILARQDKQEDLDSLGALPPFSLVCVNLYPFVHGWEQKTSGEQPDLDLVELIDIGGSALLRAAAKNHRYLSVLCHPKQYGGFVQQLEQHEGVLPVNYRKQLALEAFKTSARYDAHIAQWLGGQELGEQALTLPPTEEPETAPQHSSQALSLAQAGVLSHSVLLEPSTAVEKIAAEQSNALPETLSLQLQQTPPAMRYGENPHQPAALYTLQGLNPTLTEEGFEWPSDKLLHGKPLSYNNVVDFEAAWALLSEFTEEPTVAIIKHTQPCGVASAPTLSKAFERALDCDPLSAFGGIVVLNSPVDKATAELMAALFLEVIVAPGYTPDALETLQRKKNLRLLSRYWPPAEALDTPHPASRNNGWWLRQVSPTQVLLQQYNYLQTECLLEQQLTVVTEAKPSVEQLKDMAFAWRVCKHVKSNAIVVAKDAKTLGLCGGQTSRVGSLEKAIAHACEGATGAVLASDGFFPATDNIEIAAQHRIVAIIQPGGSIKDAEVIAACNRYGIAMVTTGVREFKH